MDHVRLEIVEACDGVSWAKRRIAAAGGHISLWVNGLPRNADVHNVKLKIDGARQQVLFVGGDGQVNARFPALEPSRRDVTIECGGAVSAPFRVDAA